MERKGFNFLKSYHDIYQALESNQDKVDFMDALFGKQFFNTEPNLSEFNLLVKLSYIGQKHNIDKSVKGYLDKTKSINISHPKQGGRQGGSQGGSVHPTQHPLAQEQVQVQEKEQVQVQVQVINNTKAELKIPTAKLESRKQAFKLKVIDYKNSYCIDMLKDFFEYWSEHGENDRKMRFEKQKSFGISRRLSTWKKRQIPITKNNPHNLTAKEKMRVKIGSVKLEDILKNKGL